MRHPLPEQRIVRGAIDATLSHQFYDADGDADDPEGTVTVAVTRSNGDSVTVGSVSGSGTAARTVSIGIAELATVDQLTAVWSVDGTAVATDTIDVVGGTIGSVAAIQATHTSLTGKDAPTLKSARKAVEDRFLSTQNRSPVERLVVQRFDGTGTCRLYGAHFPDLVSVKWAKVWTSATASTSLTADELAAINTPDQMSHFERLDGKVWQYGRQNIEIAYTFGLTFIPEDLRRALFHAVRVEVNSTTTGVPERASSWGSADGITFGISTPGQRGAIWGIPEIDDVWNKYRDPRPMVA